MNGEQKANQAVQFLRACLSPLIVPIREFLLGVGHSQVASFTLLGLCALGCTWIWSVHFERVNEPAMVALSRERDAHARWYELKNAEVEAKSPVRQWSMAAFTVTEAGISIEFARVEGATQLRAVATLNGPTSAEKLLTFDIPPDDGSGIAQAGWTAGEMAPAWAPDGFLNLQLEQVIPGLKPALFTGARRALKIPGPIPP